MRFMNYKLLLFYTTFKILCKRCKVEFIIRSFKGIFSVYELNSNYISKEISTKKERYRAKINRRAQNLHNKPFRPDEKKTVECLECRNLHKVLIFLKIEAVFQ